MKTLRKLFYVFDMVLLALLFFSLGHTMFRENFIIDTMLDVALLLRIVIPFLLYRYEKMVVWPILVFFALFGIVIFSDALYNTVLNMGQFLSVISNSVPAMRTEHMVIQRNTIGMAIMHGVIYWICLMPIGAYIVQYACKSRQSKGYPWYYFIGGIMFKDRVGRTFLRMAFMLAIAYLIGYEMQENLSFFALIALSIACYYYWNRHIGRQPHWTEYLVLFVGLYIFDKAQYQIDNDRIMYLLVSAVTILAVCCWMAYKTRHILIAALAFVMVAFLLPTVSLGYNVYQSTEGARGANYTNVGLSHHKGYMYIQRSEIVDGKEMRFVGVRDRYRTTIPCEYSFVYPTEMFSPFAKCVKYVGEKRDSVVRSVEEGYMLE
jgi:hypothetical protein